MGRLSINRIIKNCLCCGKEMALRPCEVRKGGKFCSRSCAIKYRNLADNPAKRPEVRAKISANHADVSGENNPMHGRRGPAAPGYIDGRKAALGGADKYVKILWAAGVPKVCELCGSGEKLNVHHKDGDHQNNILSNLCYLCTKCHQTIAHKRERDSLGRWAKKESDNNVNT